MDQQGCDCGANGSEVKDQNNIQDAVDNAAEKRNGQNHPHLALCVEDIGRWGAEGGGKEITQHQNAEAGNCIGILCAEDQRNDPARQQNTA